MDVENKKDVDTLSGRFILIDNEYRPENVTFNLWVRKSYDGFSLMAVSLAGTEIDLMEALSDNFINSAEAHIDRIYLYKY